MTYEEYNQKLAELEELRDAVISAYIMEHAEYKVGDRIKLIEGDKVTIAQVVRNQIRYGGDVHPILQKVKKNGELSSVYAYAWSGAKIEKI